jgi:hypothetical protein
MVWVQKFSMMWCVVLLLVSNTISIISQLLFSILSSSILPSLYLTPRHVFIYRLFLRGLGRLFKGVLTPIPPFLFEN